MIEKTIAFLGTLTSEDLQKLPPARLRQFSELCRHWHQLSEVRLQQPKELKAGILSSLKNGDRAE